MDKVSLVYLTDKDNLVQTIEFNVRGIKKSYRKLNHPVSLKLGDLNNRLQLIGLDLYVKDSDDMDTCLRIIVDFTIDFIHKNILGVGHDFESAMLRLGSQAIVNDIITMIRQFVTMRIGFADTDIIFKYIEPILEIVSGDVIVINTDKMFEEA